ncbi:MAG TPA: carboxypeptidase-like regulatory domain-containing protein, partial [Planctomycetota bacterium]|nr:carboxypeptidase-like regulatory domain-containing protein [Planctomycetota bacterium]
RRSGRNYLGRSDDRGRFAIEGLPAGSYEVTAGPGVQANVELAVGQELELELRQRLPPSIRGRVTDADGPVAGAWVTCYVHTETGAWKDDVKVQTNAAGEFQAQLKQVGECLLQAEQGGNRTLPRKAVAAWDTPSLLDLAFGGERVGGRVVSATTGEPLVDATIRFNDPTQRERDGLEPQLAHLYTFSTSTGDQGRFETRRVEPGRYTLEVSKKGYAAETREGVEVPGPAGAPELSFELVPGAIVNGTVRAAGGGVPEGEWMVQLRVDPRADGGPPYDRRMTLPPDRRFERRDLPAGRCLVKALRFVKGSADASNPWTVAAEESRDVASGETTTVDLVIAP